jgi:hypothetical protein
VEELPAWPPEPPDEPEVRFHPRGTPRASQAELPDAEPEVCSPDVEEPPVWPLAGLGPPPGAEPMPAEPLAWKAELPDAQLVKELLAWPQAWKAERLAAELPAWPPVSRAGSLVYPAQGPEELRASVRLPAYSRQEQAEPEFQASPPLRAGFPVLPELELAACRAWRAACPVSQPEREQAHLPVWLQVPVWARLRVSQEPSLP